MPMRHAVHTLLRTLAALCVATPLAADPSTPPPDPPNEPKVVVEVESSSHVVRQEDERLHVFYDAGVWDFEALAASLTPRFREQRDQLGLLVSRLFGAAELTAVARATDKPGGEDLVAGVRYARTAGANVYGVEVIWGQADLAIDDFLVGDGHDQFVGQVFWRRENGLEISVFGAASGTYDLMRGAGELLERLPRSEIVGAETLADLDVDEARLEDSAGVAVGFGRDAWRGRVYAKSGEQLIRGVPGGDDFTGFGGELHVAAASWSLDVELDLRRIDPVDGFGSFERGRALIDFRHRPGRFEWGVGGYVLGEAETFDEIPDVYNTAGLGLTASWRIGGERRVGLWTLAEDDAPDLHVISRVAFFYRTARGEIGAGVRRDEIGPRRFKEESTGPFVFGSVPLGRVVIQGDVGVQESDVYGKLSIRFKR